ncbi:MMPL family transporter [Cellulomonas soli]|uniref:MMPL family transporter n=1 Tax=Cellulomonas soli TaxID=931535 RepID=UPI003F84638E
MAEFLYRVGLTAARRARTVVAAWLAVLAAAALAYVLAAGTLATSFSIPGTPTAEVTTRLQQELPGLSGGSGTVVVRTTVGSAFTAEQQAQVAALIETASQVDGVEMVVDPFATEAERVTQTQQVTEGRAQLDAARAELAAGQAQLDAARAQAQAAGLLDQAAAQLDAQQAQIDEGVAQLDAQAAQLDMGGALLAMADPIRQVSEDGSTAIVTVAFTEPQLTVPTQTKEAVVSAFEQGPLEGAGVDFSSELAGGVPSIVGIGEAIGVVVAGVVLVVMLGTLIGAGLPLLTALIGVGIGALGSLSLSGIVEMASVTPILGVMLGLAVGIDYSLFIINRHRHQLKQGYDVEESIGLANGTSGNAVVFAGATVLIALLALNVTGIPFLGLMGSVGAASIAIAVLIAVTLTPALLALVGPRILSRRERAALGPATTGGSPGAVTGIEPGASAAAPRLRPQSTPAAIGRALLSVAALVLIALPAADLHLGLPDGSSESHGSTQYRAYSAVAEQFGAGRNGTLLVVADLPGSPTQAEVLGHQVSIATQLAAQDDVVAVAPIGASEDGTVAAFQVVPADGPTTRSTEQLVHALRELTFSDGVQVGVAGQASGNIDISDKLADALPAYLGVVVGLSLVILVLVFRSLFVPVIATAGFVLSYLAALGGVVMIYQWGWLADVFGVDNPGAILNFLPTILVGILFGLAMDYMLFLGSGMREAYAHGAPARIAVVQGVRAGRAVVSAAAIIMVAVFGGFVFSHSAMIRPIGFALAFGVLIDAFVVRMVLVPALMHLAGDKAWWLPRWLDRLLPNVDVEGAALERRHPHVEHADDAAAAGAATAAGR